MAAQCGALAKVNPPIRPRADVEYLWEMLLDGKLDWVVSAQESPSTRGYTPFEGMELSARVKQTWLRGRLRLLLIRTI